MPFQSYRLSVKAGVIAAVLAGLSLHIETSTAETTLADYRIAAGDVLEFDFLDDQEMPRQLTVGGSGQAQIPLLGAIAVAGSTIAEAHDTVRKAFIDKKMLVDPKIALTVGSYRPIFVLGDIRNPGSFPYRFQLTVEQAVGLAGGLVSFQSSAEDRIMLRARLEGDLATLSSMIAREASWVARLEAQLDGRNSVSPSDLMEDAAPFLKPDQIATFLEVENRILKAELTAYESQTSILSSNISETTKQLALFEQLQQNQKKAIQFTKDEVDRAVKLRKSGLNTAAEVASIQRQFTIDEGRFLQILADTAGAQRQIAALKQQLAALEDNRRRDALIAVQERTGMLKQHFARYRSLEEQLALAANWATAEADSALKSVISFTIRQRPGESAGDIAATGTAAILPGDVVIVSVKSPDPARAVQSQATSSTTN
ncbi:MAG: polysaccharide biosynthesis/export family protein [Aestuariivirga sp.]